MWPSVSRAQLTEPAAPGDPQPLLVPREVSKTEQVYAQSMFPDLKNVGQATLLATLFSYHNDSVDFLKDASITPGTFTPLHGLSVTLVLHGGTCQLALAWYNADAGGAAPAADKLYTIIANTDLVVNRQFEPLAMDGPWTLRAFTPDIIHDPNYLGGPIGFALVGNKYQSCTETKYTERVLNTKCTSCDPVEPFITTVIYKSQKSPLSYYLGFDDLPVDPTKYTASNDADFNDFVFYVENVGDASLGDCDTGLDGACSLGKLDAGSGGAPGVCMPVESAAETCDGADNDCNGKVDDGASLCASGQVCDNGKCVPISNGTSGAGGEGGESAQPGGGSGGETIIIITGGTSLGVGGQSCPRGACVGGEGGTNEAGEAGVSGGADKSEQSSGCGCRLVRGGDSMPLAGLALAAGIALFRRRARRG
jgi:hypothetical protein